MIERVLICPNGNKDKDLAVTNKLCAVLLENGLDSLIATHDVDWRQVLARVQCIITIGGDGTLLHVAKRAAQAGVPVIGVNMGNLGFMTELEVAELEQLPGILRGGWQPDPRMMLQLSVERGGTEIYADYALNDAVLSGGPEARMVEINVRNGDMSLLRVTGDGLIVSTPTGSTAYSLSAGGPVVEPCAECLLVTAICPHRMDVRSVVLSAERKLELSVSARADAWLSVDGNEAFAVRQGDIVTVARWAKKLTLMRVKENGFMERIGEKLS
ncbi:MAG: NAD(+)/NADH kinase [Oscillospiraceae bacterium]|nr:NAD(+)/NADH kinase [Oscillospiraceae bacterium]